MDKAIIDKSSLRYNFWICVDFKKEMIGESFVITILKLLLLVVVAFIFNLMKIISWNVNSVRARIENIKNYIKDSTPDVLCYRKLKHKTKIFQTMNLKN